MPEISSHTPTDTVTIDGETFVIPKPYAEGHTLTKGEASQLNQVFVENIRNNFAQKVKKAKEADAFELDVFQSKLIEYCEEYEMGVRSGGGSRTTDPVGVEALSIARDLVRNKIKERGINLSNVSAKQITEKAREVLAGPQKDKILAIARARVEEVKSVAEFTLGEIAEDNKETPVEEAEAPLASSKGRSKAAA